MRLRSTAAVAALAAATLLAPLATTANAVTTTSTLVAYVVSTGSPDFRGQLYTRIADGSAAQVPVFTSVNDVKQPQLSPDGTQIAYLEDDEANDDYDYNLYVRNANGTGTASLIWEGPGDAFSPSWSHDGTKIVFSSYDYDTGDFGTWTVPSAGGAATLVPTSNTVEGDEPSFSPSGRQVAVDWFAANGSLTGGGIDLVTLSSGTRAHVAGTTGGSDPVWSPDGQWLLFMKKLSCGWGLYKVPVSGGAPVAVRSNVNKYAASAEFSRDGSQLWWHEGVESSCAPAAMTRRSDVWVGDANAGGAQLAFDTPGVGEYQTTVAGGTPLALETTAPAAPVVNAVGTVAATSVTVSWTADQDATEFVVQHVPMGDPAPAIDAAVDYRGAAHSATVSGLVTGTAYDVYVWAIDASGNQSVAPSAAHPARPRSAPTMTALGLVSSFSASPSFPVHWAGTTPFEVSVGEKHKNTSGFWTTAPTYTIVNASTAATSMTFPGTQGHTYYLRVRGLDGFGNMTAYASQTAYVPVNENAALYTAGWAAGGGATRWMGTYRGTTLAGKQMSLTVDTSSFKVIGDRCPSCGSFKVYVDGVLRATVSSYSATSKVRQVLYAGGSLGAVKSHRIQVVALGTAGHPRVDLDGIGISR